MFLGWTHHLACHLNIRRFVFSPSGAMALSVIYSLWCDMPNKTNQNDYVSFTKIPNCPKFPWNHISPIYRSYIEGDPLSEFIKDGFLADVASWGLLLNSFAELEGIYLEYLKKQLGHNRVWAVGPLLLYKDEDGESSTPIERGGPSSVSLEDVMTWLDTCKDHKVVYICFGSQAVLTNDQMEELASGLEKSGVHFIWFVREITKTHEEARFGKIPYGFEDRVVGKGLVIKGWVPQTVILSHQAIGAFLTHCGWNSILEGLVAGVPMLGWTMGAYQFSNATLLVDVLKVALRVCEGTNTVPNSSELARFLIESVSQNQTERERAKQLSKAAIDAIKDGGSSVKDFDEFMHHLSDFIPTPCIN